MTTYPSFKETLDNLKSGKITCEELVKNYLLVISEKNRTINAFAEVFEEESLVRAKVIDKKIANGNSGKLAGMVIGVKDNICIKNHLVTASSKMLSGFISIYNATAIERILEEDAIIIGRLNCDEFAMGSSNENSIYGPVKNPHNELKVAGGSSGGSAAAVASEMCLAALGSDTGGSVRQPSAFCGVVGLKPTYSRISRYGLIAYASSFDQIGTITKNIDDAALLLEIMSGKDDKDNTSSSRLSEKYFTKINKKKKRKIAIIKDCFERKGLDKEIKSNIQKTIKFIKNSGHEIEEVEFPYLEYMVPTYYVLTTAEASSNLSRFDGIRYGHRSKQGNNLEETFVLSRTEGFGDEVKRRIMLGCFVLSAGYSDAYYKKAQQIRRIIHDATQKILEDYDFLLSPTTPHTAFDLGKKRKDPTVMYLEDIFTVQANISGNPAISLPLYTHSNGLPFAMQLLGKKFDEKNLLSFSSEIMLNI